MVVIVLDNGGFTAKVGLNANLNPMTIPNCIMKAKSERRRAYIGNEIDNCADASGLFYMLGFKKGLLTNWEVQKTVWDYIFGVDCLNVKLRDNILIVTEPLFNLRNIQEIMMEILFEEFECSGIFKTSAPKLAGYNYCQSKNVENCVIIDVGFSFTHIMPFINGTYVKGATRRIEIGGKILTNYLKEVISYRYINMMDETFVVNQIKEDLCFVSQNFLKELDSNSNLDESRTPLEYVLPDFSTFKRGFVHSSIKPSFGQQTLKLSTERFTVPELLFNPSDIGILQMGIPEAVIDSIKGCPEMFRTSLLKNVVVIGGSSLFPGFLTRLKSELEKLAPDHYEICVFMPESPATYSWQGGRRFSTAQNFEDLVLKKSIYEERGLW